jgi:hypothetical protein
MELLPCAPCLPEHHLQLLSVLHGRAYFGAACAYQVLPRLEPCFFHRVSSPSLAQQPGAQTARPSRKLGSYHSHRVSHPLPPLRPRPAQGCPEALNLVAAMVQQDASQRPSMEAVLAHPLWWSEEQRLQFLVDISDRWGGCWGGCAAAAAGGGACCVCWVCCPGVCVQGGSPALPNHCCFAKSLLNLCFLHPTCSHPSHPLPAPFLAESLT